MTRSRQLEPRLILTLTSPSSGAPCMPPAWCAARCRTRSCGHRIGSRYSGRARRRRHQARRSFGGAVPLPVLVVLVRLQLPDGLQVVQARDVIRAGPRVPQLPRRRAGRLVRSSSASLPYYSSSSPRASSSPPVEVDSAACVVNNPARSVSSSAWTLG